MKSFYMKETADYYFYFRKRNGIYTEVVTFEYEVDTILNPWFVELTEKQRNFYIEHPTASIREIEKAELDPPYVPPEPTIEEVREEALKNVDKYAREAIGEITDVLGFCDAVAGTIYSGSRGIESIYTNEEIFKTADGFLRVGKLCREKVRECNEAIIASCDKDAIREIESNAEEYFHQIVIPTETLEDKKRDKIREIEVYDISENVNGFFLNGTLLWLDKDTRTGLVNTLNSAALVGREQVNIWFAGMYITLHIEEARQLLAVLEIYATDCYNVTSQHKVDVMALQTVEEVEAYDITSGYPNRPEFSTTKK